MRRGLVALGVIAGLAGAGVPALAAGDATIIASDTQFDPSIVEIHVGATVTFANAGGTHNFGFDDGQELPAEPTAADHPFSGPRPRPAPSRPPASTPSTANCIPNRCRES